MSATSPCLLRDNQKWRNKGDSTVAARSAQSVTSYRTVIPGDTRMSSSGPPSTIARFTPFLKTLQPRRGGALFAYPLFISEHPTWGRQKGVTPICSDSLHSLLRFAFLVPIHSVFFPICFQNKSGQIRETPFCQPLLEIPD